MYKYHKRRICKAIVYLIGALCISLTGMSCFSDTGGRACTGSNSCSVCKNCRYCKHCAKRGNSCGVCRYR